MNTKHSIRILLLLIAVSLLVGCLPAAAFAEAGSPRKSVRVGYFTMENFMEGGDDGSLQSGFTYELLCEIAAYNHWDVEYVYGDFSDLYNRLADGEIDVLPNIIATEERRQNVLFDDFPLNEEHYYISALRGTADPGEAAPVVLKGKRLATVKDALEEKAFDVWAERNSISMAKVYCSGFDEAWNAVRTGKADYILNINNTAPDDSFVTLFEVGMNNVYFAVAKNRGDVLQDIDYAFGLMDDVSPFLIANLRQKYLNDSLSSRQLSAEEFAWVTGHEVLRIGGLKNDVPYAYEDKSGAVVGTYVEMTEMILKNCSADQLRVEWTLYDSVQELRAALKAGELDLICPEYHSYAEADSNNLSISETVMNIPMGLLMLATHPSGMLNSVAIGGTRPGLVYAKESFPNAEMVPLDSVDALVDAVADGKADAATAHIYALQDAIHGDTRRFRITPLSDPCEICYAALEENHELIMLMNRGYHLINQAERNSMELRNTATKTRTETAKEFLLQNIPVIFFILLFIAAVIAYAVRRTISSRKLGKDLEEIRRQNEIIEASRAELEVAKEQAQAADRAKTAFLFNMSHDIRTPMNAIIGFNNIALSHLDEKEVVRNSLNKISIGSRQLLSLINDVLDMARIESGTVRCETEPTDIKEAADNLMEIVRGSIEKPLNIEVDSGAVVHSFVLVDRLHTERILTNILSNSVKYTPEGGTVRFSVRETPAGREHCYGYDFVIEDNGIGMSEEFLEHIYEEFSRERTSTVSGVQGTGLGMAITKRLTDLLGGTIDIQSRPGEGTKVTVHLDMEAADSDAVLQQSAPAVPDAAALQGKKILLVEDNELNREIAEDILSDAGVIVDTAEDGDIAVEKMRNARAGQYDLILMDIQMPRMNGYEATMAIRSLPDHSLASVPIVAMTANAFEEDKQNAVDAGMNGHLSKPIDVPKLLQTLSDILN